LPQALEGVLEGDYQVVAPSDRAIADKQAAEITEKGYYESVTGEFVNAHGEIWNPDLHATAKDTGLPTMNTDGTFRARRGTVKTDKHEETTPDGAVSRLPPEVPQGPQDDDAVTQPGQPAAQPASQGDWGLD
jgi:hypothetical protein